LRRPSPLRCGAAAADDDEFLEVSRAAVVLAYNTPVDADDHSGVFDLSIDVTMRAILLSLVAAHACFGLFVPVVADQPAPAAPAPKKVAILIFDGVQIIDYSGPYEVFADADYDVFTVAETRRPVIPAAGDGERVMPKYTFADAPQADLVVIPGGDFEAKRNSAAVAWIKRENQHDRYTMSVCNGAFTLANTGLLDGLSATTTAGNNTSLEARLPKHQSGRRPTRRG
jgi:hypothetical protein